jgi:hypothetical protein
MYGRRNSNIHKRFLGRKLLRYPINFGAWAMNFLDTVMEEIVGSVLLLLVILAFAWVEHWMKRK